MTGDRKALDWNFIGTWVFRVFIAGTVIGGAYAVATFANKVDVAAEIAPLKTLPAKIDRLEEHLLGATGRMTDIEDWRRVKDQVDVRMSVIQEGQQKYIDRQQLLLDRQQFQIDQVLGRK